MWAAQLDALRCYSKHRQHIHTRITSRSFRRLRPWNSHITALISLTACHRGAVCPYPCYSPQSRSSQRRVWFINLTKCALQSAKTSDGVYTRSVHPWGRREISFSLTYAQTAPGFCKCPLIIAAPSASLRIRDARLLWSVCSRARSFATLSPFATASAWTSIPLCGCTWSLRARPRGRLKLGRKVPSCV